LIATFTRAGMARTRPCIPTKSMMLKWFGTFTAR
jgi:hypothetical protein